MKSIKSDKATRLEYPGLMESPSGQVIMFTSKRVGVVVAIEEHGKVGDFSTDWPQSTFTPYTGTITLSNE